MVENLDHTQINTFLTHNFREKRTHVIVTGGGVSDKNLNDIKRQQ